MTDNTITVAQFQRELQNLISRIEKPASNNVTEQEIAHALFIANILSGAMKPYERSKDKIKASYSDKLAAPMERSELFATTDVIVFAKVDNGRNTFDKDAFITTLVTKFGLSGKTLHDIAAETVKTSAPVVTLTAEAIR